MSAASSHLLLVEDDQDVRESIKDALEEEGYAVAEAVDGVDALERLRAATAPPDLILLDLRMPRMGGVEFRKEVTKVEEWSAIPILVLTADANPHTTAEAMVVDGYLRKPVKLDELFACIARLLRRRSP